MRPSTRRRDTGVAMAAIAMLAAIMAVGSCAQRPASPGLVAAEAPTLPSTLALACRTCHVGPDRQRHAGELSSWSPRDIADALRAWRDNEREGTVMPRLARALSDTDIDQVSRELAGQP